MNSPTNRHSFDPAAPYRVNHFPSQSIGNNTSGHVRLHGFNVSQKRLSEFCVLLLGLGAVNAVVLQGLAHIGVGRLIVCDMDSYELDSHETQPVDPGHAGNSKVHVQSAIAQRQNPNVEIIAFEGFAQDLPMLLVRSADLIILAGDNLELLVTASELAMRFGKPLIEASVMGEMSTALLRRFDLSDPAAACPACTMNELEWQSLRSRLGCSTGAVRAPGQRPTRTLPALCALAAQLATCEAAKQISNNPRQLNSEEVAYCAESHHGYRTKLLRNNRCRLNHRATRLVDANADADTATLQTIIGPRAALKTVQVKSEIPWIHVARCSSAECSGMTPIGRFARIDAELSRCKCGASRVAAPLGSRSVIPVGDLERCLDKPISQLGLNRGEAIAYSSTESWTYWFPANATVSAWLEKQVVLKDDRPIVSGEY